MIHYLYKIINNINNKVYYGIHSTKNEGDGYMGSGKALLHAYKKYGKDTFTKDILYFAKDRNELNKLEEETVTLDLINKSYCYNLVIGGNSKIGYKHTEEAKKKISEKSKGRVISKATIKKIVDKRMNKNNYAHSIETINKIKNNIPIRIGKDAPMWGKEHSQKTKDKISKSKLGIKLSAETIEKLKKIKLGKRLTKKHTEAIRKGKQLSQGKVIIQYDLNYNFIKEWVALSLAARELNIHTSSIRRCCKGNGKSCGGFKWDYKKL